MAHVTFIHGIASQPPADQLLRIRRRALAFSFQDNEPLDHEGPPQGHPPNPTACRVHYRAPPEGGSSGSPVFNARLREMIALHHMDGCVIPWLDGQAGRYAANQEIRVRSLAEAVG